MPEYTRTSFSSASLDELIAAVRTGDLDFPLAHRHTHFLTAFRTAEDAVCLVGAFLAEQGANRSRDLQELLVFCLAACNIWIALLFISGGAVIGITVYSKKKKENAE